METLSFNQARDERHWQENRSVLSLDVAEYVEDFNERVLGAYQSGTASHQLAADSGLARSFIPPGTAALRDFSHLSPEIPAFDAAKCAGCMSCVTECPDTAILGKAIGESKVGEALSHIADPAERERLSQHWARNKKYFDAYQKKGEEGALFGIFVDPTKCKGCGECVAVCDDLGYHALHMQPKQEDTVPDLRRSFEFFHKLGPTPKTYINEKALADMMLKESDALLYTGGAGSCVGCGQATAIRMMLAATGCVYGRESVGVVASTGCNSVYGATYPYNPYLVPWTNSLFENAPADAMGIRLRWDQAGHQERRLWVIGGDGAMYDIGFQSLSRLMASGMDVKVMVLDTQVYSNTGGQASTATFTGQDAKMSAAGRVQMGKSERRKEVANIAMFHPRVFVAQTTASHANHFYKAIMRANAFKGPALINVYSTCQPEHGVGDDRSSSQARLAVESRAFPLFTYDPEAGSTIRERLSLTGNPGLKSDWYTPPGQEEPLTFLDFARTEGRFRKSFDKAGNPLPGMLLAQQDRLDNWRLLRELAGQL